MPDVNINVGTEGSTISDSDIEINDIGNKAKRRNDDLAQRIATLEQLIYGDVRLGLSGYQREIRSLRFWIFCNITINFILTMYEIFSFVFHQTAG